MKKRASLLILAVFLFMAATLQGTDPEDVLRSLPSPEVNYPVEEIRIKPSPESLATDPVPLPPPARPYEVRKIVDKAKEATANPIVKTTRKIVETLSRPKAKVATHTQLVASAARSIATSTQNLAAAKAQQQTIQPTWVVKAAMTLAENPVFTILSTRIASETAFARDVFDLYVQGYENEEKPEGEEQPTAKFDSIMVTASGLQKKAQWQELKDLFSENPEAGATVEGLRFQIEAEINSAKPNYMNAQRFARQLLENESDDPLGHYAMALFHYNSKKPNLTQAKKSLDIALKAKNPPAGASNLYWVITLKGMAIPLLLVFAGIAGGVAHLIKKRKAAAVAILVEGEESPIKDAGLAAQEAAPAAGLKAKLQAVSAKVRELLKKIPFGKKKDKQQPDIAENTAQPEKNSASAVGNNNQSENQSETPVEKEIEGSEDDDEEIYELEGEDSELIDEDDADSVEEKTDGQEESDDAEEIIEEILVEEGAEEELTDEVEIIEIEEEESTETVEEIIEEIIEEEEIEEEEIEEVEYEEVEYEEEEDEPAQKG